ncbi:MAG: hypothetical protein M3Z84_02100 [Actinomycetota bacterium]|nr:hypothetical protein [Actinomycetota bacterium]
MDAYAQALYESVTAAVPGWIEHSILRVFVEARTEPPPDVTTAAVAAGLRAQAEVGKQLKPLLEADIDEQPTTPLSIVRGAVRHATAVLEAAGIPAVERDETQQRLFPDDLYDLTPAALGDVDPGLTEPGLVWGAHKAMAHLQRHGSA